jgi:hypothetical protein
MIWVAVGVIHLVAVPEAFLKTGKSGLGGLIVLGLIHLCCGLRTLGGTASGTVRSGIFSLVYGFVWTMVAVVGAKQGTNPNAPLLALGIGVVGVALLVAGCLAMIASADYQRWRTTY